MSNPKQSQLQHPANSSETCDETLTRNTTEVKEKYTSEQLYIDLKECNSPVLPRKWFSKTLIFDLESIGNINLCKALADLYSKHYQLHAGSFVDFFKHHQERYQLMKQTLPNLKKKIIVRNTIFAAKKEYIDTAFYLNANDINQLFLENTGFMTMKMKSTMKMKVKMRKTRVI